jgi:hypothetical protein
MEQPDEVQWLPEEQVRALVVLAMQSTLPGVDLADATSGYVSDPPYVAQARFATGFTWVFGPTQHLPHVSPQSTQLATFEQVSDTQSPSRGLVPSPTSPRGLRFSPQLASSAASFCLSSLSRGWSLL